MPELGEALEGIAKGKGAPRSQGQARKTWIR
jgi:hypothetical protein